MPTDDHGTGGDDPMFFCDQCVTEFDGNGWDVDGLTLCDDCHALVCTGEVCGHE